MTRVTDENGNLLNKKSDEIKNRIIHESMDVFFSVLESEKDFLLHNMDEAANIVFSSLLIVNREIICHMVRMYSMEGKRKQIIKDFCSALTEEVNAEIRRKLI